MADKTQRYEDNATGEWYVDKSCILCSACAEIAPNNFTRAESEDHDTVYKQPKDDKERQECIEALDTCPVGAIGNDN